MEFKSSKGIYQQIGDEVCEKIISRKYQVGDKIPSVREYAAKLGVNHNTIMRTYTELQRENIIENKRGIGFFVAQHAVDRVLALRKKEFFESILPDFIRQVELLSINKKELKSLWDILKD